MDTKIIQVFYGENYLPYKDSSRQTDFPIVGNVMLGSNNVCKIRFYVRDIGGADEASWIAITKLPNGQTLYEILGQKGTDTFLNERYVELDISSLYTNIKGNITISLAGYEGEIQIVQDSETGIYELYGDPLVGMTGSIKLAINYTVQIVEQKQIPFTDLQLILAYLSKKADVSNTIMVYDIRPSDLGGYLNGQLFYIKQEQTFYELNGGVLVPYNMLNALTVESQDYIIPEGDR